MNPFHEHRSHPFEDPMNNTPARHCREKVELALVRLEDDSWKPPVRAHYQGAVIEVEKGPKLKAFFEGDKDPVLEGTDPDEFSKDLAKLVIERNVSTIGVGGGNKSVNLPLATEQESAEGQGPEAGENPKGPDDPEKLGATNTVTTPDAKVDPETEKPDSTTAKKAPSKKAA